MIKIEALVKSFGSKTVLDRVSFHFPDGSRVALVGANGAGKTTLLNLLTGDQDPDGGVILKPSRLRLGYLPQEPNPDPLATVVAEAVSGGNGYMQNLVKRHKAALDLMTENYSDRAHKEFEAVDAEFRAERGYALESDAKAVLSGLGFTREMQAADPRDLSGGWRMRLELAKIFINRPNFLVLDEPTNHLDLPSLVWVERWLSAFKGTLLFVSHDRGLLRRLPTEVLHLDRGQLTNYQGHFESFLEQRERRLEEIAAKAENLRKRREHLEKFVERFGAKATKAAQAQSKMKMIGRIRDLEGDLGSSDDNIDAMHLDIPSGAPSGREVLKITDGAIGYQQPLSRGINLLIERGQKIAVIGANGIGKSTLLKTIVGRLSPLSGQFKAGHQVRTSWFAQDQVDSLDFEKSIMENVLASSATVTRNAARNVLGALLFRGDDVEKKVKVLSGGEKARVGLACLLLQEANFLLLDEPTNHLDISSCEIISQAIDEYEGTVLFVSHDREFIDSVCTHIYAMLPDGRGMLFEGKLDDYRRLAVKAGFEDVLDAKLTEDSKPDVTYGESAVGNKGLSEDDINALRRDVQKARKSIDKLDGDLARLGRGLADIEAQMAEAHSDFSLATRLDNQRRDVQAEIESAETKWLELSEFIETSTKRLADIGRSI